jgi:hypothetical protein
MRRAGVEMEEEAVPAGEISLSRGDPAAVMGIVGVLASEYGGEIPEMRVRPFDIGAGVTSIEAVPSPSLWLVSAIWFHIAR